MFAFVKEAAKCIGIVATLFDDTLGVCNELFSGIEENESKPFDFKHQDTAFFLRLGRSVINEENLSYSVDRNDCLTKLNQSVSFVTQNYFHGFEAKLVTFLAALDLIWRTAASDSLKSKM